MLVTLVSLEAAAVAALRLGRGEANLVAPLAGILFKPWMSWYTTHMIAWNVHSLLSN
jgi:hypothetical protein